MDNILEVEGLSKSYASHKALDNVTLNIPKQSIFGLLGPNGAGKTTLIRIITQIFGSDTGSIRFMGEPLAPHHTMQVGYLPEERGLYRKMKVGEQLLYLAKLRGMSHREAMEKLKVWFEKFEIKTWWNKQVGDLSKGMQQKIQFVATVLHNPPLIILDEPFTGFDPINTNIIKQEIRLLQEQGSTIIFSTHRMESVEELCDQIALINKSQKVLDGPKKQIKDQYKTNTFFVQTPSSLQAALPEEFRLLNETLNPDGLTESLVQIPEGSRSNQLLEVLIPHVDVLAFREKIPSINEIFISLVTDTPITATFSQSPESMQPSDV